MTKPLTKTFSFWRIHFLLSRYSQQGAPSSYGGGYGNAFGGTSYPDTSAYNSAYNSGYAAVCTFNMHRLWCTLHVVDLITIFLFPDLSSTSTSDKPHTGLSLSTLLNKTDTIVFWSSWTGIAHKWTGIVHGKGANLLRITRTFVMSDMSLLHSWKWDH